MRCEEREFFGLTHIPSQYQGRSRLTCVPPSQYQSVADAVERCVKELGAIDFVM